MILRFFIFISLLNLNTFAKVDVYFSPSPSCKERIIKEASSAKKTIKIAIFDFTNKEIAVAIESAIKRGIKVMILTDKSQKEKQDSIILRIKNKGALVKFNTLYRLEHNKFAIFDEEVVLTGSANWTNSAFKKNSENCVFILEEEATTKAFIERFDFLWQRAV